MTWNGVNQFLVKEHVGMFKAANNYDIYDLATGEKLLECREPGLGFLTRMFRFTDYKRMTPFHIEIRDMQGDVVVQIKRGISIALSKVDVMDGSGRRLGGFKQKLLSVGGSFHVLDENDSPVCMLKGKWTGWDFRFMNGEMELAHVTKKWTGIGREMFTSADNYVLDISSDVPPGSDLRKLIFAAVMCIDMVLKE